MSNSTQTKPNKEVWVVGVDEVGRGPVAGPVTIGVCACPGALLSRKKKQHALVGDSKKISEKVREAIARELRADGDLIVTTASVSARVIDGRGISRALRQAVARALRVTGLDSVEMDVRLDGRLYAPKHYSQRTIIKGDATEWVIGAASIVAKVKRDGYMIRQAKKFPSYGFEQHKGYGTKAHYAAIKKHGLSLLHRRGFLKKKNR